MKVGELYEKYSKNGTWTFRVATTRGEVLAWHNALQPTIREELAEKEVVSYSVGYEAVTACVTDEMEDLFYEIAEYGNENWKGSFTKKEVTDNAATYFADYLWSLENETIADSIKYLAKNLAEDYENFPEDERPKNWLQKIATGLGLLDMDAADHLETDGWLTCDHDGD